MYFRIVAFSLLLLLRQSMAQPALENAGLSANIDSLTGTYSIHSAALGWTFGGSLHTPLHHCFSSEGKDSIGYFHSLRFSWHNKIDYTGSIKYYQDQPVVLFNLELPEGCNTAPTVFPQFTQLPAMPYGFSYHNHIFALPQFVLEETCSPWLLFNDKAESFILSPASQFMIAQMRGNASAISVALNPEVKQLPARFSYQAILVLNRGIRHAWDTWGQSLRRLYGRQIPANDRGPILKYYGFWTDNGSDYYYNYDTSLNYDGTLLDIRRYYQQQHIPIGYMQLDSWWYQKTRNSVYGQQGADKKKPLLPAGKWNRSGGIFKLEADSVIFPKGLADFQHSLGLPLVTHSRWIDSSSPYHQQYKISGISATDPAFWEHVMLYLQQSGVKVYEQDWMNYIYRLNPDMHANWQIGPAFTDGMAQAAEKHGIDLQYCMTLPRYYLQGLHYNNLTSIRPSGDRFMPKRWMNFVFTSQLAYSTGIWPWSDVFKSNEMGNMIVSVLSAGAVGTGDTLGTESKANILMACRPDAVLVKPDEPLLPLDENYVRLAHGEHLPIIAHTFTRHSNIITHYIFAFADDTTCYYDYQFSPAQIGMRNKLVLFNTGTGEAQLMNATDTLHSILPSERYDFFIAAPLLPCGIAFLGDAGKIAATGKQRIAEMSANQQAVQIKVAFSKGREAVILRGYATAKPNCSAGKMNWDESTHLFTISLKGPRKAGIKSISISANGN